MGSQLLSPCPFPLSLSFLYSLLTLAFLLIALATLPLVALFQPNDQIASFLHWGLGNFLYDLGYYKDAIKVLVRCRVCPRAMLFGLALSR